MNATEAGAKLLGRVVPVTVGESAHKFIRFLRGRHEGRFPAFNHFQTKGSKPSFENCREPPKGI